MMEWWVYAIQFAAGCIAHEIGYRQGRRHEKRANDRLLESIRDAVANKKYEDTDFFGYEYKMIACPKDSQEDDSEFLNWLRTLRSCIDNSAAPCEPCHVRRVSGGAGMGRKPAYSAVPMTHEQHAYQHQHGEYALLKKYGINLSEDSVAGAKAWFDYKASYYKKLWDGGNGKK